MLLFFARIKNLFVEHWFIGVTGAFLAFLIIFPVIIFPLATKDTYQKINLARFPSDAQIYMVRVKEVAEKKPLGNTLLREGKDKEDLYFMYGEKILLAPFTILGISQNIDVVLLIHIYTFFIVWAIIILMYAVVYQLSGDRRLSALTALFIVGGYHIVYNKTLFYSDYNMYGRTMIPFTSFFFFFIYLNALVRSFITRKRIAILFAAITFGIIFYIYFFAWTFALALNGILFLICLYRRDWQFVKHIVLITGVGLLLGSYQLFTMSKFFLSPAGEQADYYHWSSHTRQPIFSKIGAVSLALWFFIFIILKKVNKHQWLLLGIILTGWVALNQQVITGKSLQIGHYYWYFIVPLGIIVNFYLLWQFVAKERARELLLAGVTLVVFLNTAVGQYRSFLPSIGPTQDIQEYRPILDILNTVPEQSVVLANDNYSGYLITIYTNHDLFWHSDSALTNTPLERFEEGFFVFHYLNKNFRDNIEESVHKYMVGKIEGSYYKTQYKQIEGYRSGFDYYDYLRRIAINDPELLERRKVILGDLVEKYKKINNPEGIISILKKYGTNYIVWDRAAHPEWDLSFIANKKLIYTHNNLFLYQIIY